MTHTEASPVVEPFDVAAIKADFPLLKRVLKGHPIAYLDSAASSQKPQVVIDAMSTYYETINANVHRGVYEIAEAATNALGGNGSLRGPSTPSTRAASTSGRRATTLDTVQPGGAVAASARSSCAV